MRHFVHGPVFATNAAMRPLGGSMNELALGAFGTALLVAFVGCAVSDDPNDLGANGYGGANAGGGSSSGVPSVGGGNSGVPGGGGDNSGVPSGGGASGNGSAGNSGGQKYPKLCDDAPPAGAQQAADAPGYSGGSCPDLGTHSGSVTITSSGAQRQFLLVVPTDFDPGERLPVMFLWHWIGGSAESFLKKGDVQSAVDQQRFIAVIPQKKGDVVWTWPFAISDPQSRMEEEFKFFDDMLSCVSAQFDVNKNCVGQTGVSSGALFVDQLVSARSQYISSFESLSGGVGGIIKPWGHPQHRVPGMVLWGGSGDNCMNLLSFDQGSQELETALQSDGNFFIECKHNCGHAEPPFDDNPGFSPYKPLWDFAFSHPYWLGAGQSPFLQDGLPNDFPSWCGIGKGSATPRTGACPSPSSC
jgi:hypothetical protein